jgi:hypothetical protein
MRYRVKLEWYIDIEDAESEDDAQEKAQKILSKEVASGGPFDCYSVEEVQEPAPPPQP